MSEARFVRARQLFPGAEQGIYMDVSVRGLLSTDTKGAVDRYLEERIAGAENKRAAFDTVERARHRLASLIGASADEIAITKNTSEGLNIVAAGLTWKPGDNLVFCPEIEHPNNVYPWLNLKRRLGVEVRAVPTVDGRLPVEGMLAAMDGRTRLVTLPTVSFSPGFITDIAPVARACEDRGAFLLLDAAQSVGVLHTDVRTLGAHGLAAATQKGLLAFYGMGFLYVRREAIDRVSPAYLARFGVDLGRDAHETAMNASELVLAAGARRFDLGNYNYLGAVAIDASLGLLLDLGSKHIDTHVRQLANRLATGLRALDLPVCGGAPGLHLGHIVAVGTSGGGRHDSADDPAMNRLYEFLRSKGVRFSIRRGVLRFSLHLYNNDDDVDRVIQLAREWVQRG